MQYSLDAFTRCSGCWVSDALQRTSVGYLSQSGSLVLRNGQSFAVYNRPAFEQDLWAVLTADTEHCVPCQLLSSQTGRCTAFPHWSGSRPHTMRCIPMDITLTRAEHQYLTYPRLLAWNTAMYTRALAKYLQAHGDYCDGWVGKWLVAVIQGVGVTGCE